MIILQGMKTQNQATPDKSDYDFMRATYMSALNAGLPIISSDTSARILSVVYVHGNNEFMVHSPKFHIEMEYMQQRFHLFGGETPDLKIVTLVKRYVKELEEFEKQYPVKRYPEWAVDLFKSRYNVKLIN